MKTSLLAFSVISAISFGAFANHLGEGEEHLINYSNLLEYKGKPASEHTIAANNAFSKKLPWDDRSVIERQKHG